jgi:hypothetical protein
MKLRIQLLACLLLSLTIPAALGFFSTENSIQRPSPSPKKTLSKFHNQTFRSVRLVERQRVIEAIQNDEQEDTSAVSTKKEDAFMRKNRIRNLFSILGGILYSMKASCAVIAIHLVLNLKMEGPVLQRLPPNILLFLLEVSINRPGVMHSVARELGKRISSEVSSFTGKEAYEVGDISKAIVARYHSGKEDYRFGDLTRATISRRIKRKAKRRSADSSSIQVHKEEVQIQEGGKGLSTEEIETVLFKITGKKDYEFGDVTKAVLKRMRERV